jgi:hypothetical protein
MLKTIPIKIRTIPWEGKNLLKTHLFHNSKDLRGKKNSMKKINP